MSGFEGLTIEAKATGILVFGIQAAKFIAESVSNFQDTEENYERFLGAIERLARVLTDVNELLQSYQDKLRYSSLYKVSKTCEDELVMIQQNILEWTGSGKRSKTVRTWKEFKFLFLKDNLGRQLESLESHYGFITFQMNRIQLDDRKGQKEAAEMIETAHDGLAVAPDNAHESVPGTSSTLSAADAQVEPLVRIEQTEANTNAQQMQTSSTAVQDLSTLVEVNFDQVNGTPNPIDSTKLFASTQSHKVLEVREHDESEKTEVGIFPFDAAAATRRGHSVQQRKMGEILGDVGEVPDFAKDGQFAEFSKRAVEKDDSFGVAKGSICFDGVEQPLSAAVDEHCSCLNCYPDSEDEDIEILDKSSVDEFLVDDDQLWDSDLDTGLNCLVFPESPRKALSPYEPNDLWDEYEAFEELTSNTGEPIYQPNHDASVSTWARILEGWDYVNSEGVV